MDTDVKIRDQKGSFVISWIRTYRDFDIFMWKILTFVLCVYDNNVKFVHLVLPQCKILIMYKKGIPILLFVSDLIFCINLVFCNNCIVYACVQNYPDMPVKCKSK